MHYLAAYFATAIVFLGIDAVWIGIVAKGFYRTHIGSLLADSPNLGAAAGFYAVYVVGVVFLAILPALREQSWSHALIAGGVLGLVAYGTYDVTNFATLKGWSLQVVVVDIVWGTALTAVSALVGYFAAKAVFAG